MLSKSSKKTRARILFSQEKNDETFHCPLFTHQHLGDIQYRLHGIRYCHPDPYSSNTNTNPYPRSPYFNAYSSNTNQR